MGSVLRRPYIDGKLRQLTDIRLAEHDQGIYIAPQAKANPEAPDGEFYLLMAKVEQFLESEQQVFLITGDSGSGKSTFSRYLDHSPWKTYTHEACIPLFISLSVLQSPETDLIPGHLKMYDFTYE
ncbi:hypothetical protein BG015_004134, partial [Linnemannia schmuckeri]